MNHKQVILATLRERAAFVVGRKNSRRLRGDELRRAVLRAAQPCRFPEAVWVKIMRHDRWKAQEAARKSHPEAKRARDDARFRRSFLARRRREIQTLLHVDRTVDGVVAHMLTITDRILRLNAIRKELAICSPRSVVPPADLPEWAQIILIEPNVAAGLGAKVVRRGRNWKVFSSFAPSHSKHENGVTEWRKGRPIQYDRARNDNYVRSFGVIRSDGSLDCLFHETRRLYMRPDGWEWSVDTHGLVLRYAMDDRVQFHPTADSLLRDPGDCSLLMQEAFKIRRRWRKEQFRGGIDHSGDEDVVLIDAWIPERQWDAALLRVLS